MDTSSTPTGESSLDVNQAGAAFAAMLDPQEPAQSATPEADGLSDAERAAAEAHAEEEKRKAAEETQQPDPDQPSEAKVTVEVDGKTVELTKEQIAEAYKSGLRQADYTQKTQATAEEKKAAIAEKERARAERQQYAEGLQRAQAVLESQLQEQQNIDWQTLLQQDPVEYLKQQHLAQTRQAQLQQTYQQRQQLEAQAQAEHQEALKAHVESEREKLIANIPEWKDEAKRKAGATELMNYLKTQGLSEQEIVSVTDSRAIFQSYKAMKYDQMMAKAAAAAKKIDNTPQRVLRPTGGESPQLDRRTAAFQKLSKSGRVEDAGAVFASLIS